MNRKILLSTLFFAAGLGSPALALDCAAGRDVMGAVVVPPSNVVPSITEYDQYAWLDGARLVHVCDLNGYGQTTLTFNIFAGEYRQGHGICMSYTIATGETQYSCARPSDVSAAMAAPRGTPANTLRFVTWSRGLPSF